MKALRKTTDGTAPGPETLRLFFFGILLFCFVCLIRAPGFFWTVINWDESIYLLISRSVLEGNVLYTDIWDRKQPLTFVLFAIAQIVFGQTILSIRWLGCIAVATTCLGLVAIARRTFERSTVGQSGATIAAILYALYSVSSGGLATNTEILFAPFSAAAVAVILPWWVARDPEVSPAGLRNWGVAGLLLGLSSFTKLIAVFDAGFVALLLVTGWWSMRSGYHHQRSLAWLVKRVLVLASGFACPWIIGAAYFWTAGAFDEFIFANFTFNRMNLVDRPPISLENLILVFTRLVTRENGLLWLGFVAAVILLVVRPRWISTTNHRLLTGLVLWAALGIAAAVSLRRLYLHYYLQPTPALALVSGLVIVLLLGTQRRFVMAITVATAIALLIPQGVRIAERWRQIGSMTDVPAVIAAHLRDRVRPGEYIYIANDQPILYFLTETRVPTRWAFPQFLISPIFRQRLGIDLDREMASIFEHRPVFVVFNTQERNLVDPAYHQLLFGRYLAADYELDVRLFTVALFRRRVEEAAPTPFLKSLIESVADSPRDGETQ